MSKGDQMIKKIIHLGVESPTCSELMQKGVEQKTARDVASDRLGNLVDEDSPLAIARKVEAELLEKQRLRKEVHQAAGSIEPIMRKTTSSEAGKVDHLERGSGKSIPTEKIELIIKNEDEKKWEKARLALIRILQSEMYAQFLEGIEVLHFRGKSNCNFSENDGQKILTITDPASGREKVIEIGEISEGRDGSENLIFRVRMSDGRLITGKTVI